VHVVIVQSGDDGTALGAQENLSLSVLHRFRRLGLLRRRPERPLVQAGTQGRRRGAAIASSTAPSTSALGRRALLSLRLYRRHPVTMPRSENGDVILGKIQLAKIEMSALTNPAGVDTGHLGGSGRTV